MSDPIDLEALEALEQAATPGPWVHLLVQDGDESGVYPEPVGTRQWSDPLSASESIWYEADSPREAALIVATRNALPGLLAEVRALRGLARWLVSLDDVEGPGFEARRTVRLNDIVTRAARALASDG